MAEGGRQPVRAARGVVVITRGGLGGWVCAPAAAAKAALIHKKLTAKTALIHKKLTGKTVLIHKKLTGKAALIQKMQTGKS